MPQFDIEAARKHLASYDETCRDYRDEQDNPTGVADSRAYEEYEDGLTTVVHDLATALRAAVAEIAELSPPATEGEFPMPAAGTVADGDTVKCPHVDEDGERCGGTMELIERVWDYRDLTWREREFGDTNDIVLAIGVGMSGDGEHWSFECNTGHVFDLPDPDSIEYV